MGAVSNIETEVKSWLKEVLNKENIKDFCVKILGNSGKGDGYMGDILFVHVMATKNDDSIKEYNLVLKCSKRSEILREKCPVQEAFLNEIYIYDTVLPVFTQFQMDKQVENPFESVPKFYGTFITDTMEVIVFENLKKVGYELWDKRKPLTRKHIDVIINEYGKFHAISVAMQEQQPENFQKLTDKLYSIIKKFNETTDIENIFGTSIEELCDILANDLDENILQTWRNLKHQIKNIFSNLYEAVDGMKVILHGDCWNNNFMFKHKDDDNNSPTEVAVLDWQLSNYSSPIFDLSYFLFSCISRDDLKDLDVILNNYYKSFTNYLSKLGSDAHKLYPYYQFMDEWKKFCRYGILMTSVVMKICSTNKDEVIDIADTAEKGEDIAKSFLYEIKDKSNLKDRASCIIKYVVEHDLI